MNDTPATSVHGETLAFDAGTSMLVFRPADTRYELQLVAEGIQVDPPNPRRIAIHARARKVWTINSGGGFIEPIVGTPRRVQGRVVAIDGRQLIVQAGARMTIEIPVDTDAVNPAAGPLEPGAFVSITLQPGARAVAAS